MPPVPEFVLPMIAVEKGYFRDHGIEATITVIPGGQSMPAALQSDSLQVAALSTASLIQVTDSGLDLVIVSGGAIASVNDTNYGIVAGANSGIEKPEDFVGKKIGTPGLGQLLPHHGARMVSPQRASTGARSPSSKAPFRSLPTC